MSNLARAISSFIVFFAYFGVAFADVIQLTDGSRINGSIVGISGNQYTIQSSTMGRITLSKSKVQSIVSGNSVGSSGNEYRPKSDREFSNINRRLNQSPDLVGSMNQLQSNPTLAKILNDPALMHAVQQQDWETLQNNPLIRQLMNDPNVRSMTQQLKQ